MSDEAEIALLVAGVAVGWFAIATMLFGMIEQVVRSHRGPNRWKFFSYSDVIYREEEKTKIIAAFWPITVWGWPLMICLTFALKMTFNFLSASGASIVRLAIRRSARKRVPRAVAIAKSKTEAQ